MHFIVNNLEFCIAFTINILFKSSSRRIEIGESINLYIWLVHSCLIGAYICKKIPDISTENIEV